jgi:superfamily II DNA or RNA helicase
MRQALSYISDEGVYRTLHQQRTGGFPIDQRKYLFSTKTGKFPSGLLKRVEAFLKFNNVAYGIEDKRPVYGIKNITLPPNLWQHQQEAIVAMIQHKRGLVSIPTGGGKSWVAGHFLCAMPGTCLVTVPTIDLLEQTAADIEGVIGEKVGLIGDGVYAPERVTVGIINSLLNCLQDKKRLPYFGTVGCWLYDETHGAASEGSQQLSIALNKTEYRIGMSGTPWRTDGTDMALEAVMGTIFFSVTEMELINRGVLRRPTINFIHHRHESLPADTEKPSYKAVYRDFITENDERTLVGLERFVYRLRNSRTQNPGIVLLREIKHGQRVQELLDEQYGIVMPFIHQKSSERREVIAALRERTIPGAISSSILDVGVNIRPLEHLLILGGGASEMRQIQRIGRVLRDYPGKADPIIDDIHDVNAPYIARHSAERLALCEDIYPGCVFEV